MQFKVSDQYSLIDMFFLKIEYLSSMDLVLAPWFLGRVWLDDRETSFKTCLSLSRSSSILC